jgi:histone H4
MYRRGGRHERQERALTARDVRRIAHKAGVRRVDALMRDEVGYVLEHFIEDLVREALIYQQHDRRETMTSMDVALAVKRRGHSLYGFRR